MSIKWYPVIDYLPPNEKSEPERDCGCCCGGDC